MRDLHAFSGYIAIAATLVVGIWGIGAAILKRPVGRVYRMVLLGSVLLFVAQIVVGVSMFSQGIDPGSKHTFYGFLWLFTATFIYLFREQLEKNPPLRWGLTFLYLAWLGYRGVQTFGLGL
jgi:hypothetical protein